ncbi:DUF5959 family protein [Streptomyces capitiformicae]|uniref:Uncharacterized protein n=2 Tax=Streptomyces capitiformicae TaxID=2014920 RepID=A0A918ZI42_9ACTN|nr:hypothetical protein GCM10017771_76480 [Streptomyces capitiformicae]
MNLINLSDSSNSVRLHLLGRQTPGILPTHDLMVAEVIVGTNFISGSCRVYFFLSNLEQWSSALNSLENGQDAEWLDTGNGPTIRIECARSNDDDSIIAIEDTSDSSAKAFIPMAVHPGWVQEQRRLLEKVVRTWPIEVMETSPGSYKWKNRDNQVEVGRHGGPSPQRSSVRCHCLNPRGQVT